MKRTPLVVRTLMAVMSAAALIGMSCAASVSVADTPDGVVNDVAQAFSQHRPQVAWHALPASYQNDVTSIVHEFANKMDPEIWNQTFQVLNKVLRVLGEKKEFILASPMVAEQMDKQPNSTELYDGIVSILRTLTGSPISDLDQLRTLSVESFLANTGAEIMRQAAALEAIAPDAERDNDLRKLRSMKATLVSSEGDSAVVRVEAEGEEPEEVEFVRVEGKWIPKEMADGWQESISEIKDGLAELTPEKMGQNKAQFLMGVAMVNGTLDGLLAAETAEEFNEVFQGMASMVMMGMMGQGN